MKFKRPGELGPLVRLSIPIAAVNLGQQLMGLVDTAIAGRIDDVSLAATGLGSSVFMLWAIFGIGVALGVDPIASQAFGAGRPGRARQAMWQGLYVALLAAIPIGALIWFSAELLELLQIDTPLADQTRTYLAGRLLAIVPMLALNSVRSYLQAAHLTKPIVAAAIVANIFNFAADWLFVFGDSGLQQLGIPSLGLPRLGVEGIGWATTVSTVFQFAAMAWAVRRYRESHKTQEKITESPARPNRRMLLLILTLGIPIGLQLMAEMSIFSIIGLMAGRMGTLAMASHQVALMLAAFSFMVPLAIGTATSVQVGRAIGREDSGATRQAGLLGLVLATIVMASAALLMWILPGTLASMISKDPRVVATAIPLILIAGAFQIFDGIQAVGSGALRGAGLTRWAMVANLASYWLIGLPLAYLLGVHLEMGPPGLWWGLTAGLAFAAVTLAGKFLLISRRPIAALVSED